MFLDTLVNLLVEQIFVAHCNIVSVVQSTINAKGKRRATLGVRDRFPGRVVEQEGKGNRRFGIKGKRGWNGKGGYGQRDTGDLTELIGFGRGARVRRYDQKATSTEDSRMGWLFSGRIV